MTKWKDSRPPVACSTPASTRRAIDLEAIVKEAAARLSAADRAQLLASQDDEIAERTAAGAKLDAAVAEALRQLDPGNGWIVFANRPVRCFPGLDAATSARTIQDFVRNEGLWWCETELRPLFVDRRSGRPRLIGNLRPDLVIQDPTMLLTIWDLTSTERVRHLAKTLLYAHVFARGRHLCQIGETYWAGLSFA